MKQIKVRLLVSRASEGGAQNRDEEILVPENEVEPMIEAGQCELVDDAAAPKRSAPKERAIKAPKVEKAVG
jgi:hypothetical protein